MVHVRRTLRVPDRPEQVEVFKLPSLNKRIVGPGISNHVIYDLKKRGVSEVEFPDGSSMFFEVVNMDPPEKQVHQI